MAQYAILIYAHDSAHAPDATPADIETCDQHSDELADSGSMVAAYALTPRDMATSVRIRQGRRDCAGVSHPAAGTG